MQLDFGFPRVDLPHGDPRAARPRARRGTAQQFEFLGFDRLQQHTVFFAVLADAVAAQAVDETRRVMAARAGLTTRFADPARLHMSLVCLCRQSARQMTEEAEQAAVGAARFVCCDPFDIVLDRLMTFGPIADASDAKRPIVLTSSDTSGMRGLYERLHGVLERARIIGGKLRPFTPHMTVLYGAPVPRETIAPIRLSVREFHLVHSLHGKSQYRIVASFPLRR